MKFKIGVSKRLNVAVTLVACASGLWLMVNRFGLSVDTLIKIFWVALIFLGFIVLIAAPAGLIYRWYKSKTDED